MAVKLFSDEMVEYLKEIAPGKYINEITTLFNDKFETEFTETQIRTLKTRHKIRSNVKTGAIKPKTLFTQEQENYIYRNLQGKYNKELASLVNGKFGTSYTAEQVKNLKSRRNWNSGLTGHFPKGHTPANKGKKGISYPGMEPTQFKEGHKPHNWVPIGSERITRDGYLQVKIQEGKFQRNWKGKHILIWEKSNGPLPKGHVILFGDGNKRNFDLDNLILVSRRELLYLNQEDLIQNDAELTKTAVNIVKLQIKISEAKKK